jgi:SAM-dependent methyltransferase
MSQGERVIYGQPFYDAQREGSRRSAQRVVPHLLGLVRPRHVVDVGCGVGTWLSVFRQHGIDDVLGIDGEHVRYLLEIPESHFSAQDVTAPQPVGRVFDLVLSLEVAEHLPAACAEPFVAFLTGLGAVVLFSAAIPNQGGTNHLNEQWPDYWADLFGRRDFLPVDAIRPRIWQDEEIEWWYAQNAVLFVHRNRLADDPVLGRELDRTHPGWLSLVHPRRYQALLAWLARLDDTRRDLTAVVPRGEAFIFVDQQQLDGAIPRDRVALPFLERDGEYWGPPADDRCAVTEFERLCRAGARAIAFAWPAFWWLDHYRGLASHLRSRFPCRLENERLIVFEISTP